MPTETELLYQDQRPKESFKHWLLKEYTDKSLTGHPYWMLALEIQAKWPDFPEEGRYIDLGMWLSNHDACHRCMNAFRGAWVNYINDG